MSGSRVKHGMTNNNMNTFIQSKYNEYAKVIEFFEQSIKSLRTGRANAALLDGVMVNAYGSKSPLSAVAGISVEDARSMTITPWDKGVMKEIEKAVVDANLGVGAVNEGEKIRVTIPMMTEENRKNLVKQLHEKLEQTRINIRHVRDEIKKSIESAAKEKTISEDEKFRFLEELEEETHQFTQKAQEISEKKTEDIMRV